MADIIPFRKPKASEKARGNTLCRSGFHKWEIDKGRAFDVRQGKLLTVERCTRCGKTRNKMT